MWRILLFAFLWACAQHKNDCEYMGCEYLNKPYLANPLGEERAPDMDPLIRFDAFDCTTFVETVLADGNLNKLNQIRYANGQIGITTRNHFIETDWLTNNSSIVTNVSANYAETVIRTVTIDKQKWFKHKYGIDTEFAPETVQLEYIPYKFAQNIKIDKPMLVLFINDGKHFKNRTGTDLAVRHMGFLLPGGVLRHASSKAGRVLDANFSEYINEIMENKNNLGIMLLEIKK